MEFSFKNCEEFHKYCIRNSCSYCKYLKHCEYGKDYSNLMRYNAEKLFNKLSRRKKLEKLLS